MKSIIKISLAVSTALFFVACGGSTASVSPEQLAKLDVKSECNIEARGINAVLASAQKYNDIAKAEGLEFMRLGMKTSQYIAGAQEAVKNGAKSVAIVNKKKKKTGMVSTEYAAWRACSFAVSALTQQAEGKKTWRLAVPGDGYKF